MKLMFIYVHPAHTVKHSTKKANLIMRFLYLLRLNNAKVPSLGSNPMFVYFGSNLIRVFKQIQQFHQPFVKLQSSSYTPFFFVG